MTGTFDAVVVVSGGLDSTVVAYLAHARHGSDIALVSFDYGQRHRRELECAQATADRLGVPWRLVDLTSITDLIATSALTSPDVEVPEGHYADDTMRSTVVPNRNAIMLNIAAGHAVAVGAGSLWTGVHAGDHPVYPDCRPDFIAAVQRSLRVGNEGFIAPGFRVVAPFLERSKADVVVAGSVCRSRRHGRATGAARSTAAAAPLASRPAAR